MRQPDPFYWGIDEPKKFHKSKVRLPKEIQAIYNEIIAKKLESPNPVDYKHEKWEATKYGLVWMVRLNNYWRFSYVVEYEEKNNQTRENRQSQRCRN